MDTEHFDLEGFFLALDAARTQRKLTWKQVAAESRVSASTLTRMAQGRRPDVDGLGALLKWSGLRVEDFLKDASASRKEPETLAVISTLLRADRTLSKESAAALEEIIKVTYTQMVRKG